MKITESQLRQLVNSTVKRIVKEATVVKEGPTLTFTTPKQAADHLRAIADKWVKQADVDKPDLKRYGGDVDGWKEDMKDWKEDEKMYLRDRKDLNRIADKILSKDYEYAAKLINNLDTAVRDMVPRSVFRFLEKTPGARYMNWKYD